LTNAQFRCDSTNAHLLAWGCLIYTPHLLQKSNIKVPLSVYALPTASTADSAFHPSVWQSLSPVSLSKSCPWKFSNLSWPEQPRASESLDSNRCAMLSQEVENRLRSSEWLSRISSHRNLPVSPSSRNIYWTIINNTGVYSSYSGLKHSEYTSYVSWPQLCCYLFTHKIACKVSERVS
jgi:hypothetical protein